MVLCNKHWTQMKNHGRILERTKYDKNKIHIYEDYAEVEIYNKDNAMVAKTIVDISDVEKISKYKWHINKSGYVLSWSEHRKNLFMHRLVTECPNGLVVDHIDHDTLNNRKSNLRVCSQGLNCRNRAMQSNNTTGYTGVYWKSECNRWYARITVNKHDINLGHFIDIKDAINAYQNAAREYFGEFANIGCDKHDI